MWLAWLVHFPSVIKQVDLVVSLEGKFLIASVSATLPFVVSNSSKLMEQTAMTQR